MGKRVNTTKREAISKIGEDYYECLQRGYTTDDFNSMLGDNGIYQCEVCKSWEEAETTGGNGEATLCEKCYHDSDHELAVEARKMYTQATEEECCVYNCHKPQYIDEEGYNWGYCEECNDARIAKQNQEIHDYYHKNTGLYKGD